MKDIFRRRRESWTAYFIRKQWEMWLKEGLVGAAMFAALVGLLYWGLR